MTGFLYRKYTAWGFRKFPLYLLLCGLVLSAQAQPAPRDTSFTLHSAFTKARKKQPFISIAEVEKPAGVLFKSGISFAKFDKHKLHLDIFYPLAIQKRKPAVLLIFGGGWRSGDRTHNLTMAKKLAANGFVAVTADYRLSTEALYPAAVYDLKAAIRWMRANAQSYGIDTTKIAVLGCSAGGELAAFLGNTNRDKKFEGRGPNRNYSSAVQAVVNIDGTLSFVHPESGEGNDANGKSAATYWFGASKLEKPALWQEASPLDHVGANSAPILFLNSSVPRMHAGRDDMIKKLDSLKIYSEVHTFNDAPHTFWFFNPWFEPAMNATVAFLNKIFEP